MKSKKRIEIINEDNNILLDDIIDTTNSETATWDESMKVTSKIPCIPIDNSKHIYVPVHLSCGVTLQCQLNAVPNSYKVCINVICHINPNTSYLVHHNTQQRSTKLSKHTPPKHTCINKTHKYMDKLNLPIRICT